MRPYLEPRLAALALRTVTDCFAGDGGDARGGLLAPRVVRAGLYRALSCEMRGVGRVEAAAWARDAQGRSCGRHNAGSLSLENGWKPFTAVWTMPREASAGDFKVFSWRNGEAAFEVRGLRLVNE